MNDAQRKLTLRELEILNLLCHGKTMKETAFTLGIRTRTVRRHVSSAKRKFGAETFYHLAFLLGKAGLDEGTNAQGISR